MEVDSVPFPTGSPACHLRSGPGCPRSHPIDSSITAVMTSNLQKGLSCYRPPQSLTAVCSLPTGTESAIKGLCWAARRGPACSVLAAAIPPTPAAFICRGDVWHFWRDLGFQPVTGPEWGEMGHRPWFESRAGEMWQDGCPWKAAQGPSSTNACEIKSRPSWMSGGCIIN